jgi:serine O-acetyltransferase
MATAGKSRRSKADTVPPGVSRPGATCSTQQKGPITVRAPRDQPRLPRILAEDLQAVLDRDPSVQSRVEALLHPGLAAVWLHRLAHRRHRGGHRLTARLIMTVARRLTGVEIHPGAQLGRRVFIDHGAAVVIGETAVVGDDVTLFHQVTLGAVGWWRDNAREPGARRHPVIGAGTVLGAGCSVLGAVTVGEQAFIGAHALVLRDVPAHGRATAVPAVPLAPPAWPGPHPIDLLRHTASAGSW